MNFLDLLTILQDPIIPIPPPFEIPAPGSGPLDMSELWAYENLYNAMRSFRTAIAFANQNLVLQIFVGIGLVSVAVRWLLTGGRDNGSTEESEAGADPEQMAQAMRNEI